MQFFIFTPGTLIKQKDECFRFQKGDKKFDTSPMKIESLIISNKAMISTQAILLALENNIDVIFLDSYGDPVGRVWFSKMGSTALIRRKQLQVAEDRLGLEIVIEMVSKKLDNQIKFLKKLMYSRPDKEDHFTGYIKTIENSSQDITQTNDDIDICRNRVMGLEGSAGRSYFRCISKLLPEKYRFKERTRRPARDEFNACLNYCYGILYSLVEKSCILSGLDPYVGFLHTDNYNKKSLVFDFIEPFRIYAEQTTVYLFTGKKIKDKYFDSSKDAVSLNENGKPVIVEAFNKHLDESVRYRKRNVKRRFIIQNEAHRLANLLLDNTGKARSNWLQIKEF
ncbi:CRISPR-associated endonuclease Cas1 [Candidatus Magnetomoraceae bacterium gMMP-15]